MDLICANKSFFKNPKKLPLTELYFDYQKLTRVNKNDHTLEEIEQMLKSSVTGNDYYKTEITKKPALDKCWIDHKIYESYHRYDLHLTEDQNKLFIKNKMFLNDLHFLNRCTYHQFWCYIYYEPNVAKIIKEFLQNAVPLHLVSHLSKPFLSLHIEIHSCIRDIYQRLLNFKVSEYEYIKEETARSIIQEKGLLSVDVVLMLCYLYNSSEPQFISKIMEFCLRKQDTFLRKINELLKNIVDELDNFSRTSFHNQKPANVVEEKAFFLFEVSSTLHQFLSACQSAIDIAFFVELPYCITYVFQKVYTESSDFIDGESNGHDWTIFQDLIRKWLALGKFECINLFHVFVAYCLDAIVNLREDSTKQDEYVELYIGLMSNALDNDLFVIAYDKTYSIREQFETLIACVPTFDVQQSEYLLKSLDTIILEFSKDPEPEPSIITTPKASVVLDKKKYDSVYEALTQYLERPLNKRYTNLPRNVSLALEQYYELTNQIGGQGELRQNVWTNPEKPCKNEIDLSAQAVLDVLPHLDREFVLNCLDKMNYDVNEVITKVLSNDLSCKPSTSKKGKYSNANEMLDDKKEKDSIKELVLKASYAMDLDDEYDERYQMGNSFSDSDEESRIYRHLEDANQGNETSSSEEEQPTEVKRDTKSDFCMDPAVQREIRERKYQSTRRVIPNKNVPQSGDKPKHSQSTRPKHNRKGGAHWKRNKGMIPS